LTSPSGKSEACEVRDTAGHIYDIRFVPEEVGLHAVSIKYKGIHVAGQFHRRAFAELRLNSTILALCNFVCVTVHIMYRPICRYKYVYISIRHNTKQQTWTLFRPNSTTDFIIGLFLLSIAVFSLQFLGMGLFFSPPARRSGGAL